MGIFGKDFAVISVILACLAVGCRPADSAEIAGSEQPPGPYRFDVTAADYAFDAPASIPSGWVTYALDNSLASEIHEVTITRLPDGVSHERYVGDVLPVWQEISSRIDNGELIGAADAFDAALELLPEWAAEIEYVHARGLISPGRRTETTVHLEPGTYVLECWAKSEEGYLHSLHGMIRTLEVRETRHAGKPGPADVELSLVDGNIKTTPGLEPGSRTVRVSAGAGLDNVHLVRLDEDTDLEVVRGWMDWYAPGGLQHPAPAEFLGGGHTYSSGGPDAVLQFTLHGIQPGRYAWIVEGGGIPPAEVVVE